MLGNEASSLHLLGAVSETRLTGNEGSLPLPCCAKVTVPNNRGVALGLT